MHRPEWCGFQASGGAGKVRRRGRDAAAPGARAGLIWRRERAGASGPGAGFAAELAPGARSVAGGRAARSAARRAGRCSAARERFPRGPFSRSGFPLLYIYFLIFNCSRNKTSSGAIETAGRSSSCSPPGTSAGWGRAARAGLERAARPAAARTGCGAAESRIFMLYFKKFK